VVEPTDAILPVLQRIQADIAGVKGDIAGIKGEIAEIRRVQDDHTNRLTDVADVLTSIPDSSTR
jgi:hypothetical protein